MSCLFGRIRTILIIISIFYDQKISCYLCELNQNKELEKKEINNKIVFYHTRKCGGWTIHNYFSSKLKTQFGNSCERNRNNINNKINESDWRCDMKYMEDTKEEEQCKAFSKFYNSSYEFSQVEQPLLLHQTFPSFITFMTVLRHPIERVISSYRMIRNTYLNEEDWTMKSWLLHEKHSPIYKVNPNRRRMSNSNPNKQFPHPDSQTSQIISSKPKVFQKLINSSNSSWKIVPKKNFSNIRSPRILPTDGLDENYMTKWFCGLWFQQNAPPVSEECYERAVENLNKFDFIFLTQYLSTDLPHVAKELGMNLTEEELKNVIPYNIRMHDPHLENERNISYSTNISNPSSIPEFSENDGTYEIAIKKNHYDLKLYRHAIYRNCLTLRKDTVSSCRYVADHTALIYLW